MSNMTVQNSLQQRAKKNQPQKAGITTFLNSMAVIGNIDQALGKDNRQRFITGVISAVNTNPSLQECTKTIWCQSCQIARNLQLFHNRQGNIPIQSKMAVWGKYERIWLYE